MLQEISQTVPRVALVTGGLKLGGSTTFLINLAGEFIRRGLPTEVFSFELENPLADDFQRRNIPVLALDDRRFIYEDRMEKILQRLNNFKPTVVVANLSAVSFEVFRYLPEGIFRVGVIHSDDANVYEMARHYINSIDSIAVVSKIIEDELKRRKAFANILIKCLSLGVPMSADKNIYDHKSRPLQILYLGRLDREQKRVHLFPQILEQLKASNIPFHWTIAGAGPEQSALQQMMKSDSPSQTISFPGKISYAQVPEILKQHDIYLLASDYEGLPLSLLEAMGAGLVPVVSDLSSGIPEVVDSTTGILVPVNEIQGYARGIIHLHEHRDELEKKSAAARERVKKEFSVEAMADRWLAIFPKEFPQIGEWPPHWKIKAPLPARHPIYFSPPLRSLRRLGAKLR